MFGGRQTKWWSYFEYSSQYSVCPVHWQAVRNGQYCQRHRLISSDEKHWAPFDVNRVAIQCRVVGCCTTAHHNHDTSAVYRYHFVRMLSRWYLQHVCTKLPIYWLGMRKICHLRCAKDASTHKPRGYRSSFNGISGTLVKVFIQLYQIQGRIQDLMLVGV